MDFRLSTFDDVVEATKADTMAGIADRITGPTLVSAA